MAYIIWYDNSLNIQRTIEGNAAWSTCFTLYPYFTPSVELNGDDIFPMVMKILMALYWDWASGAVSQCFFYGGLSPIAIPCSYPILYPGRTRLLYPGRTPPIVFHPYLRLPVYPARTPRLCCTRIPRRHLLQCRDIKAVCSSADIAPPSSIRPDPRAVRACSCKPSLPAPPTLGWELKKFTKSSTRRAVQAENSNQMQRMKGIKLNGPSTQNS